MNSQPGTDAAPAAAPDRFVWHPRYRGRLVEEVRVEVAQELARDQRAYALVLEGAEQQENVALASVLDLEKKWGTYDFGWAETDPADLAARVAAFEKARDDRRELFPYQRYRDELAGTAGLGPRAGAPPTPRPGVPIAGRPPIGWLAVAAVVVVLLLLLLVLG